MQTFKIMCKKNQPGVDSDWFEMSYPPRSLQDCEELIEYYEEEWGHFYSYRVLQST